MSLRKCHNNIGKILKVWEGRRHPEKCLDVAVFPLRLIAEVGWLLQLRKLVRTHETLRLGRELLNWASCDVLRKETKCISTVGIVRPVKLRLLKAFHILCRVGQIESNSRQKTHVAARSYASNLRLQRFMLNTRWCSNFGFKFYNSWLLVGNQWVLNRLEGNFTMVSYFLETGGSSRENSNIVCA